MTEPPRSRDEDRAHWTARHAAGDWGGAPSAWVVEQGLALPAEWTIVELAAGAGRHAAALARAGRQVIAVDFVELAVHAAKEHGVIAVTADTWALPFRDGSLDAVIVVSYLERALLAAFARLLRPGGRLIYETFTTAHGALVAAGRAKGPRNPAYLLLPDELPRLATPMRVAEYSELLVSDDAGERHVARMVAVR